MRFQREYKKRLLMCSVLQESMRCAMGNFDSGPSTVGRSHDPRAVFIIWATQPDLLLSVLARFVQSGW